jgi:hypothetical protein
MVAQDNAMTRSAAFVPLAVRPLLAWPEQREGKMLDGGGAVHWRVRRVRLQAHLGLCTEKVAAEF